MDPKDDKREASGAPANAKEEPHEQGDKSSRRPVELKARQAELRHPALAFFAVIGGAAAIVVLVVVLLVRGHERKEAAKQEAERQATWAALQGCLLGAPLNTEREETASKRFRGIQLTVLAMPRDRRATEKEPPWPVRCSGYASKLGDQADVAASNGVELRTTMRGLEEQLSRDTDARAEIGKLLDHVWKVALASQLTAKPANPAACPKPAVPVLSQDDLDSSSGLKGNVPLSSIKVEASPSSSIRFLVADPALEDRALSCSASGAPTTLVCTPVGAEAAAHTPGLSLLGTTDPGTYPWVFAGDHGQLGIYRPSGVLAIQGVTALDASVGPDGSALLLVRGPSGDVRIQPLPLVGVPPPPEPALDATEVLSTDDVAFLWSWIVLRSGAHAKFPNHLVARSVSANGVVGPDIDIGDATKAGTADSSVTTPTTPRFSACRSGANVAVRLHGAQADEMAFYTGSLWTAPVVVPTRGGELSCDKNEATVTRVSSGVVEQAHCNAGGCAATRVSVLELLANTDVAPKSPASVVAAALGQRLLIVWDAGPLGGLRMRVASASDLRATRDTLIADTEGLTGKEEVTDMRAVTHGDSALLLLKTGDGVRILEAGGSGDLTMLHTKG